MRLHVRAPTGTRIEHTEYIVDKSSGRFARSFRPPRLESISDNIGVPISYDLAFYQTDSIGPQDADVLIQLQPKHQADRDVQQRIRTRWREVSGREAYFQAADIVSQVLNFGLPSAIDVQISGNDLRRDYAIATRLKERMARIPGVVDLRIAEPLDYPAFKVDVDRAKALELGITEQQVASSVLASLPARSLLQPNFWLDPQNGVNYNVILQAPQHLVDSVGALQNIPLSTTALRRATRRRSAPSAAHAPQPIARQRRHRQSHRRSGRRRALHRAARDRRECGVAGAISAQSPPQCNGRSSQLGKLPRAPRS